MRTILPSVVQTSVTQAAASGLSARSVVKYHVMLHSVFKRAVRDRVLLHNPASETELPKVVTQRRRILTPEEFARLLQESPSRYVAMVLADIETGLRWGELIALRPMDVDFLRRTITVHRVIVEVSRKISPTGERMIVKRYPKDDEPRTLRPSAVTWWRRSAVRSPHSIWSLKCCCSPRLGARMATRSRETLSVPACGFQRSSARTWVSTSASMTFVMRTRHGLWPAALT